MILGQIVLVIHFSRVLVWIWGVGRKKGTDKPEILRWCPSVAEKHDCLVERVMRWVFYIWSLCT